jgi:hypothetical protein
MIIGQPSSQKNALFELQFANILVSIKRRTQLYIPKPGGPEPNRCMTSPQKIEVGHTLKSKNAAAFLLFKPSGTGTGTSVPIM